MNGWAALDLFLHTDPRDVGCAEAMDMLHVYVDLVAAGIQAEQRPAPGPRRAPARLRPVRGRLRRAAGRDRG